MTETRWAISSRTGQPCAAAHHVDGRLAGFAVRGSARSLELGQRAKDAQDVENDIRVRRSGRTAEMFSERIRYGLARATRTDEPFGPGTGALPFGDLYQPAREYRAAGVTIT